MAISRSVGNNTSRSGQFMIFRIQICWFITIKKNSQNLLYPLSFTFKTFCRGLVLSSKIHLVHSVGIWKCLPMLTYCRNIISNMIRVGISCFGKHTRLGAVHKTDKGVPIHEYEELLVEHMLWLCKSLTNAILLFWLFVPIFICQHVCFGTNFSPTSIWRENSCWIAFLQNVLQ